MENLFFEIIKESQEQHKLIAVYTNNDESFVIDL